MIREHSSPLDVMLIRGPSPLLPAVAKACSHIPIALLLVGDYLAGVDDLPQPGWRKELIRAWSKWNARAQLSVAKESLTFVNSHLLFEQLRGEVKNLVETRTTTLSVEDFYDREDTCQQSPIRLLYTGRMDRSKGLLEMVEAVCVLRSQGFDVVLDLVGMKEPGDPILDEINGITAGYGITDKVVYHGYKKIGPELFAFYKNADIYVIASQSSFEGFPRTIWEAMAHSLPVIATKVGSIPHYLKDQNTALLCEPRTVDALIMAIKKIFTEDTIRQKIIRNGFDLAKTNTIESRSKEMIELIREYLRN